MAALRITEFRGVGKSLGGGMQAPECPPLAHQNVTIGTETDSVALNTACTLVRLQAEALCCVEFGATPAANPAATTSMLRMTAGQTEYFAVVPGSKISVITTT